MRPLSRPPRLVANQNSTDRHATWLELLYDLVFAVAVAKLAERLVGDVSWLGFFQFLGLFVPVWWAWLGQVVYLTRFDNDDLLHELVTFALMLGAAVMAIQIKSAFEGGSVGFVLAFVFLRLALLFLYWQARQALPQVRPIARVYLSGFSLGAGLWLISLLVPAPYQYALWGLGLAVDLATPWLGQRTLHDGPVDTSHLPERLAQFNIILLGEAVTEVIDGVAKVEWEVTSLGVAFLTFCLAIMVWWKYFTFYERADLRQHLGSGQEYIYSHLPFIIALSLIGVGAERSILEASRPQLTLPTLVLVCGGTALWIFATLLIQTATYRRLPPGLLLYGHLVATGAALLLGVGGLWVPPLLVWILLVGIGIAMLLVQMRYAARRREGQEIDPGQDD